LDHSAGELGYYVVEGCDGPMPTLAMEKDVTYYFRQEHYSNYYHPLGFAYYADGAHDDVDELEPSIKPHGSSSTCGDTNSCPAPMYIKDGEYLGQYSNIASIAAINGDEDFGLDFYEPEFFLDVVTWLEPTYEVALKFDVDDFTKDFFYFCHIHQYMTGRVKFVDSEGNLLQEENDPAIPYEYDAPSEYDQSCGTHGLDEYQLPNFECPTKFVCNKPEGAAGKFADCIDSMNCAMTAGMTTNMNMDSIIALFNHQMIPHHQNAVNMCKALMATSELASCVDDDEDDPICTMKFLCLEIMAVQNFQIQTMRGVNDALGYDGSDDCSVDVSVTKKLSACIASYPGYEGTLMPKGVVTVTYKSLTTTDFQVRFRLQGLESNCVDCGISIHAGKSCDDVDGPRGHYWNPSIDDPWFASFGAVYNTKENGNTGKGMFPLSNGYSVSKNAGHAIVVHAQDGSRVGCGILTNEVKSLSECL